MRRLILLLPLLLAAGCETFNEEKAIFDVYNSSSSAIEVKINGGQGYRVKAQDAERITVTILVPARRQGNVNAPNSVDRPVDVSVAVKTLTPERLVPPISCRSGAKVIVTVKYVVDPWGNESLSCSSAYNYY